MLTCEQCGLSHQGDFETPRLARLSREQQKFAELFLLSSGSLKEMAKLLEVSYPTIRNRLDQLIEDLEKERVKDEKRKQKILEDVEEGRITATKGARLIDAL